MPATFRNYPGDKLYVNKDYMPVRSFLYRINRTKLQSTGFPWGRWEWMIGHGCLDDRFLNRIGIWEESGEIVAVATYESQPGDGYFLVDEEHAYLKPVCWNTLLEILPRTANSAP